MLKKPLIIFIVIFTIAAILSGLWYWKKIKMEHKLTLTKQSIIYSRLLPADRAIQEDDASLDIYRDLVYGQSNGKNLLLDIYRPKNNQNKLPLIIYIHGGGWMTGDKIMCPARDYFTKNGYALACVNYRLSDEAIFPAQINDVKAATRWLRSNADNYNLDANRFGVLGESAGGYLATMLGVTAGISNFEGKSNNLRESSDVQAVVDFFGPTDFAQAETSWFGDRTSIDEIIKYKEYLDAVTKLVGQTKQTLTASNELMKIANPLDYISADDPPFYIIHGDEDGVVPTGQSRLLFDALKKAGVETTFEIVKGMNHEQVGKYFFLVEKTRIFFDKYLKK